MKCGKWNTAIIPFKDGGTINGGEFSEVQDFWIISWFLEAQESLVLKVQFPSEIAPKKKKKSLLPPLKCKATESRKVLLTAPCVGGGSTGKSQDCIMAAVNEENNLK